MSGLHQSKALYCLHLAVFSTKGVGQGYMPLEHPTTDLPSKGQLSVEFNITVNRVHLFCSKILF